jgi:hypothetical protein
VNTVTERTEFVTVFHASDREVPYLRPGSSVTTSREEALVHAQAIASPDERWVLELHVRREQIEWSDQDDPAASPQHGTLLVKSVVVGAEIIRRTAG